MTKDPSAVAAKALNRRTVFLGAGAVGAVSAIAAVTASSRVMAPAPVAMAPVATAAGGYQLSEHVKRYYATARV